MRDDGMHCNGALRGQPSIGTRSIQSAERVRGWLRPNSLHQRIIGYDMHATIWTHFEHHMNHKLMRPRNQTSNSFGGLTKCLMEVQLVSWVQISSLVSLFSLISYFINASTGAFRPAWSFKHFMYLLGVTSHPDETAYDCGEHAALSSEPNDDTFFPSH